MGIWEGEERTLVLRYGMRIPHKIKPMSLNLERKLHFSAYSSNSHIFTHEK